MPKHDEVGSNERCGSYDSADNPKGLQCAQRSMRSRRLEDLLDGERCVLHDVVRRPQPASPPDRLEQAR